MLLFFSFLQSSFKRLFWTWVMLAGRLCWPTLCFQLRLNKSSIGRNSACREMQKHCSFGMKVKIVKFPFRIKLKSKFTLWEPFKNWLGTSANALTIKIKMYSWLGHIICFKNPFKKDGISMKPEKERNRVANSVSSPFAPKKIFRQTNGPSYHSIIFSHIFLKP